MDFSALSWPDPQYCSVRSSATLAHIMTLVIRSDRSLDRLAWWEWLAMSPPDTDVDRVRPPTRQPRVTEGGQRMLTTRGAVNENPPAEPSRQLNRETAAPQDA